MARHYKGAISFTELDKIPLYEFHTLYYQFWKEKDAESKLSEKEKSSLALSQAIENMM